MSRLVGRLSLILPLILLFGCVKTYYTQGDRMMQDNCFGCPSGTHQALNTAVVEYLLARPESKIREHYARLIAEKTGKLKLADGAMNGRFIADMDEDLSWLMSSQHDFIRAEAEKAGAPKDADGDALYPVLSDGVLLSRALARATAEPTSQMLQEAGRAEWFWARRWVEDEKTGTWDLPAWNGMVMVLIVGRRDEKRVEMYNWGEDLDVNVPACVADVSRLAGAFDPEANLAYEEVANKAIARPVEKK